jgi:stalled ribosome rescue protein Dom34
MTKKNKKQFGVWMDTHHATVVGRANETSEEFIVLGKAGNAGVERNTSEKNEQSDGKTSQHKFFKEILSHMTNAEEVHLTGTGTSQEQLMRYMADTPQFKNTITKESTANKMSDENLAAFISGKFN